MDAVATFEVTEFTPSDDVSSVTTGAPVGDAHMVNTSRATSRAARPPVQLAHDAATEVGT